MGRIEKADYRIAAETILKEIPEGGCGSFLTIGDPMVYSTFIYLMEELEGKDVEIEVVSGIPSFIDAAGESKSPLTKKGDSFLLCDDLNSDFLGRIDSIAILKTSKNKESMIKEFEKSDYAYIYVKRASLENREILRDKKDILNDDDYISLILARKSKL